ncbi:MAG: LysR family transcriptional regulator [Myxococcales bacterium]
MDIYQLKTFVTVARERSITRASALLHLSQPAVSAHIKAIEDALGLSLFERTPRGMSLTPGGERLLAKAEQTLAAHQELLDEATRSKGELTGRIRLGVGSNSNHAAVGKLLTTLCARSPGVQVVLKHGTSRDILSGLRSGTLDAGFYNEPGHPGGDLATVEVGQFTTYVVAAPGVVSPANRGNWKALAQLAWIYPTESACCSHTAEELFSSHQFKPSRVISADRQDVTRTLVASGLGLGLLHDDVARAAERSGEVELLFEASTRVRILFVHLASRGADPLLVAATSIMRASAPD